MAEGSCESSWRARASRSSMICEQKGPLGGIGEYCLGSSKRGVGAAVRSFRCVGVRDRVDMEFGMGCGLGMEVGLRS